MGYFKKITLWLLVLGVAFEINLFMVSQTFAQPIPKPGSNSQLCTNAGQPRTNMGNIYFTTKSATAKALDNKGNYEISITWSYAGSSVALYKDRITNGYQFYYGRVIISKAPGTEVAVFTPNQSNPFDDVSVKFNIAGKEGDKLSFGASQFFCYSAALSGKVRFKTKVMSNKSTDITLGKPGEKPTVSQDGEPLPGAEANTRTAGDYLGYQACLRKGNQCDTCCADKKLAGWISTISYVECWATCSIDSFLTGMIDWLFKGLEYIFQNALGLT